jgi:AcrR family transcriptional regulator
MRTLRTVSVRRTNRHVTPSHYPDPSMTTVHERARPGRPRRFEPEIETQMILDAALAVMQRNGFEDVTVSDILEEAGLSTRSFYRSFESKDDLVRAMYRRDAEAAAQRLRRRVEAAGTPRAAVEAWVDEILSFGYSTAKSQRVVLMGSPAARRVAHYEDESRHAAEVLIAPLLEMLERGRADGSLPLAEPGVDAPTIYAMAMGLVQRASAGDRRLSRSEALGHCLRFCLPALGA